MFDIVELAAVDPHADAAALIEQISWLERVKSAATAGQARAAAALDAKRRAAEAAAGVPKAKQGRGVAGEVALARRDSPARGGRTSAWPKRWCTRCPTHRRRWNPARYRSGVPP
jgi:hypothetical protein